LARFLVAILPRFISNSLPLSRGNHKERENIPGSMLKGLSGQIKWA
jgi:hypothetical protein